VSHDEPSILPSRIIVDLPVAPFGADRWPLAGLGVPPSVPNPTLDWALFPEPLREGFRRAGWLLVNAPTPEHLLSKRGGNTVEWPSAGSIRSIVAHWREFAKWLDAGGVSSLSTVTTEDLDRYCKHNNDSGRSYVSRAARLRAVSRLWALSTQLPASDRLAAGPWEGEDIKDYLSGEPRTANENTTPVIHPDTMGPLLVWALTFTDDLGGDIVRAARHRAAATAARPQEQSPASRTAADAYLTRLLRDGHTTLPGKLVMGQLRPDLSYLAAMNGGFHPKDLSAALDEQREDFQVDLTAPRPCGVAATAKVDGVPWCDEIEWHDVPQLCQVLRAAALIVTAYLSGMRPAEVLSLTPGCCPEPFQEPDGSTTYVIEGRRYKGARTPDGRADHTGVEQVWTTIKPVADALQVLDALPGGGIYLWAKPRDADVALDPGTASERVAAFVDAANELAERLGMPGKAIPPDPSGPISLGRFRRTLAWHIRRRPGGRVALAVQYGHLSLSTGEGYAGLREAGALTLLDREQAAAVVDTLQGLAAELADGGQLSGPAGERLLAAIRRAASYDGAYLTERELKRVLGDPEMRVFDNPGAFLVCVHDPARALCRPGRPGADVTPDLSGCRPECSNIARTDGHLAGLRREIDRLESEAGSPLTSEPMRQRLRQRAADYSGIADRHSATRVTAPQVPVDHEQEAT
jgi:integrase